MSKSLREAMEREIAVRGGVTRGLGPLLVKTFGESEVRAELAAALRAAAEAGDAEGVVRTLALDASVGFLLPRRDLALAAPVPEAAGWLVRGAAQRPDGAGLRDQLARREDATPRLRAVAAAHAALADADLGPLGELEEEDRQRLTWPLLDLFTPPRATGAPPAAAPRRVGRNDPCPCGSGKKYKRCCLHKPSPTVPEVADASGTPGMTRNEAFWFREVEPLVQALCAERLRRGGPRAGETLFWPDEEAPLDELSVRLQLALARGDMDAQRRVVLRGWQLDPPVGERLAAEAFRAAPPETWGSGQLVAWVESLPQALRAEVELEAPGAGAWTLEDVVALRAQSEAVSERVAEALRGTRAGRFEPVVGLAEIVARGGRLPLGLLLVRYVQALTESFEPGQSERMRRVEIAACEALELPLSGLSVESDDPRDEEIARLRDRVAELDAARSKLEMDLRMERDLRARAEEAWREGGGSSEADRLRAELRRLRRELEEHHRKRRAAERTLQNLKTRERERLARASQVDTDGLKTEARDGEEEREEEGGAELSAPSRRVSYLPAFETTAQRLPPSTVERVRKDLERLAAGKWVREAKRMEGLSDVWTLRAGIHYRVMVRERDGVLEVFDLIPREDLDTYLNRLRA